MKTYQANLINSLFLIIMPLWAYFTYESTPDKESLSFTALIPVIFGVILLICYKGLKNNNKIVAHIAVLITFIALLGLFMPLKSAVADNRILSIIRVSLMILSGLFTMITFVNSFIQARKNK
tara:strand:- start:1556 stop:1921 length:366 start_codon:yes stop_codon:yes gene_type:complete